MSDFDDGMAMGDEAAFSAFADEDNVLLWHAELPRVPTTGIPMPLSAGSSWRTGAPVERASIEIEIPGEVFRTNGVTVGWKIRVNERDYRINDYVDQGGTFTLLCGPLADGSVR